MYNKSIIMGRLVADPELRKTESGISNCRFSVAVQEDYKNKDGSRDVDYIICVAWRQTAEFLTRYFKKGQPILIDGKLKSRTYEKEGQKHYETYIKVAEVRFAGGSSTNNISDSSDSPSELPDLSDFEEILSQEDEIF